MTTLATLNVKTLNQLCVVHADFNIWSGKTRLRPEDIKLGAGGEIPPEKLASLGNKKICEPSALNPFNSLKTACLRFLRHYGLRFMNGYAIPADKLDYVESQLETIKAQFLTERQDFLDAYEATVEKWIDDNPEFAQSIRTGRMPIDVVRERIGFEYTIYNINAVNEKSADQLSRQMDSLTSDLYSEIEKEANNFYHKYLNGRKELNTSTRATLEKLYDKIDGLSFMNASLEPLATLLKETIDGFESHKVKSRIEGAYLYQVTTVVLICADREKIHGYAEGSVTVDSVTFSGAGLLDDAPATAELLTPTQHSLMSDEETSVTASQEQAGADVSEPATVSEVSSNTPADSSSALPVDLLGDIASFFADYTVKSEQSDTVSDAVPERDAIKQEPEPEATQASTASEVNSDANLDETHVEPAHSFASDSLANLLEEMGAMPNDTSADLSGEALPVFDMDDIDDGAW
ncbi:DUF3150 domain-containing protein [Halomonas sp. 86]|uniref:DUF3150 domain-containing protein n=1 Tax=unclassified Halomonas TaxID=2609666 RepID=UPI004033EE7F